jgi:hypothetical protein
VALFVAGMLIGGVLTLVAILLLSLLDDRPARRAARQRQRDAERLAWRDWCESHDWCPAHDKADGSCPRIEYVSATFLGPRFHDCPGSGVLRPQRPNEYGLVFSYDDSVVRAGVR